MNSSHNSWRGTCYPCRGQPNFTHCEISNLGSTSYTNYYCDPIPSKASYIQHCKINPNVSTVASCDFSIDPTLLHCILSFLPNSSQFAIPCKHFGRNIDMSQFFPKDTFTAFFSCSAIVALLTVVSNLVVVLLICSIKVLKKAPTNIIAANLSLSDIFFGLVLLPIWVAILTWCYFSFVRLKHLFDFKIFTYISIAYSIMSPALLNISLANLALLSIERAVSLACPFWYRCYITPKIAVFSCFMPWVYALLWMIKTLAEDQASTDDRLKVSLDIGYGFIIPGVTILVSYLIIFIAAKRASKIKGESQQRKKEKARVLKTVKLAIKLLSLFALFLICFLPRFCLHLLDVYQPSIYKSLMKLEIMFGAKLLSYISALLNP